MVKKDNNSKKSPKLLPSEKLESSVQANISSKEILEDTTGTNNNGEDEAIDRDIIAEAITEAIEGDLEKLDTNALLPVISSRNEVATTDKSLLDPLKAYLKEISRYKLLSIDQEKALTKALSESGDIEIAKKLVVHNLRLVVKIAMEYRYSYKNVMDLIQEGNIGLMKAVSKYNPDKGAKLSYYASWWIRSYILKFILDNFRLVKIGTTNEQKKLFYNLLKEKDRLASMGIEPDVKLLSENLGVSEKAVKVMDKRLSPSGGEFSIDTPLSTDSSARFSDTLLDESSSQMEEQIEVRQGVEILKENLGSFLEELSERDRFIFKERLLSETPLSLQKIADEYGVSRERIRQLEQKIMNNLKVYMAEYLR